MRSRAQEFQAFAKGCPGHPLLENAENSRAVEGRPGETALCELGRTVFTSNRIQAVRLPAETRFPAGVKRVDVRVVGQERIIVPADAAWNSFFSASGSLVTVSVQGDFGKPRPAVVIQSDVLSGTDSVLVCLLTMVDKIMAVRRERCGSAFDRIDDAALLLLNRLLALAVGLAG